MKLLEEVAKQNLHYSSQKVILNVCVTWWVENLDGYNHFLLTYPYIIEALEVIAHKLHLEKYLNWSDWDNESRRRVTSSILAGISNFEFCVIFTTIVKSLFYLRGPTKKIQGRSLDLWIMDLWFRFRFMVAYDDQKLKNYLHGVMREKSFLHIVSNMHQTFLVL